MGVPSRFLIASKIVAPRRPAPKDIVAVVERLSSSFLHPATEVSETNLLPSSSSSSSPSAGKKNLFPKFCEINHYITIIVPLLARNNSDQRHELRKKQGLHIVILFDLLLSLHPFLRVPGFCNEP